MRSSVTTVIAVFFFCATAASLSAGLGIRAYTEPKAATDFSLPDLTGRVHERADYRDKAYIVSFWATWCTPCIKEFPDLQRAAEILAQEDVTVLTVNSGQSKDVIEQFLSKRSLSLPILLDEKSTMLEQWRVLALPTSYIVNAQGLVVARVVGGLDWDEPSVLAQVRALTGHPDLN
ncbi:MAG: TlpA family protein disulfide reductase [Candidatus Thiodiazotropha sp. (ex Monitilora ramsayi)]|nr:TlpA family protein disulfide reductase [Candidatus Thiodiazotropha sp. (ex Monitilora ramsayi)]